MSKFKYFLVLWLCIDAIAITAFEEEEKGRDVWDLARPFVKRAERRSIVSTENGQVTAARVSDRVNGSYLLHFITLEPNSLFLPVLLHADMVFYVHTGTGSLGWNEGDEMKSADVKRGDIYRLPAGTVFLAQSRLESEGQKLRIYAIFANSINDLRQPTTAPYTSISDLVLGFDIDVLKAAFQVPESVIQEILDGAKQPAITHGLPEKEQTLAMWDKEIEYVKQLVGNRGSIMSVLNKKKKKKDEDKMYNIIEEDADFENCNGWSSTVTSKKLDALKGSDIGVFMVNLTKGSMVGPHWNPVATEIAIVLEGQGMVRVVCPKTIANVAECRNMRFHVKEGDVFVVPRFHPMAQMSFNNGSLVFMGFSTSAKNNNPQFLAGKASVLRTLNVDVVAASFNVPNTTITQLLGAQDDSCMLECVSCAEEELRILKEEMEREMDERRKREEEEARKKEEEGGQEEEEGREREEEIARREEEERKRRQEEEAQRKEEEERKEEEGRREEEEGGEREEEKARREEEERRRRREEEPPREDEERKRREEEQRREEEGRTQWRKEQEAKRRRKEEAAKEMDRRASEETRRAAEEERERERRQWEPQEGRGGRGEQGRRQWEPQEGKGGRGEPGRRQWEPQEGRGGRGEPGRRQWEPQEGRGGRGEQGRRQWERQGRRGEREKGDEASGMRKEDRSLKRLTI